MAPQEGNHITKDAKLGLRHRSKGSKQPDTNNKETSKKESNKKSEETLDSKNLDIKKSWNYIKWTKILSMLLVIIAVSFYVLPWENIIMDEYLCVVDEEINEIRFHEVPCYYRGYRREFDYKAAPRHCGTLVTDVLVALEDSERMLKIAKKLIKNIGDSNPNIREGLNLNWINMHNVFRRTVDSNLFTKRDFELIDAVMERVRDVVSDTFGINRHQLFYTNVTQFTKYSPQAPFAEHMHVDKARSHSLVVTTILWLGTYEFDFYGGRLTFLNSNSSGPNTPLHLEPKFGRFAAWTASYENPHGVEEVYAGERYAYITTFTVAPDYGYRDLNHLKEWSLETADYDFYSPQYDETNVNKNEFLKDNPGAGAQSGY